MREEAHVVEALGHDGEACGCAQFASINSLIDAPDSYDEGLIAMDDW